MQTIHTWQDAEIFAAKHMRSLGFHDADTTQAGADGGVDVVASAAVAQVKHFQDSPVGAAPVRQLVGVAGSQRDSLFYALTGYTKQAVEFAEERQVALFTYSLAEEVSAATSTAETLLEAGVFIASAPSDSGLIRGIADDLQLRVQQALDYSQQVMIEGMPIIQDRIREAPEAPESRELYVTLMRALIMCREIGSRWGDSTSHHLPAVVSDLGRLIAASRWIARQSGIDSDELEARYSTRLA